MFILSKKSLNNLKLVHPHLITCVVLSLYTKSNVDFTVFEGLRSKRTQRKYIKKGVSWTMNSYHLKQPDGFSHAVDLVPYLDGKVTWENTDAFYTIADAMKESAKEIGITIEWGGDWKRFDAAHFQIER